MPGTSDKKNNRFNKKIFVAIGIVVLCLIVYSVSNDADENASSIDPMVYQDSNSSHGDTQSVVEKKDTTQKKKPNFIIILTDDMGYGDLGVYGAKAIKTPNLDKMAEEGALFTDFYSSAETCSPSRAGMLTGRYPIRTGITGPISPKKDSLFRKANRALGVQVAKLGLCDMPFKESLTDGMPDSEITIAEALKVAGYQSALIGKWHLGDFTVSPEYQPRKHGFDYFIGFNTANDGFPVALWKNETEIEKDIGLDQARFTGLFHNEAISFMERSKDKPFFLFLSHKDPHQPCIPSEKFDRSSKGGPHGDVVQEVDWSVGEIVKYLKKNNLSENTLVLFTSDNGPWFDGSPGTLRGRKGQSFEGGYRVPMIASWPGTIPPGRIFNQPAMNIDFFPTILELAGLSNPKDRVIDGKNIFGLLTGEMKETPHSELYFSHGSVLEGIRQGKWKYFRSISRYVWPVPIDNPRTFVGWQAAERIYTDSSDKFSEPRTHFDLGTWPLLYDLTVDAGESYNLIEHYPQIGDNILNTLETWEENLFKNPRGWLSSSK